MSLTISKEMTGAGIRPMRLMGNQDLVLVVGRLTFDSSYLSGGESFTATNLDLKDILFASFAPTFSGGSAITQKRGITAAYDYDNYTVIALGASAVAGADGSAMGLCEVKNGTDLSDVTLRFLVVGYM